MKKTGKKAGAFLAALLATALLWLSFRGIDWADFADGIKICDWRFLLLSALTGGLMPACRALRWRQAAIQFDRSVTIKTAVAANYAAYLMNMAVPYTHEATRCMIIHRRSDPDASSYDRLVGIAAMERAVDACSILIILVLTCTLSPKSDGSFFKGLLSTPSSRKIFVVCMISIAVLVAVLLSISGSLSKRSRVFSGIHVFTKGVAEGLKSILNLDHPWLFWLYSVLLWFIYWLQIRFMTVAMPQMSSFSAFGCLILCLAGQISTIVPVPGGLGAYHHVIATALLSLYGFQWETGVAFATLVHESQALVMIISGTISWMIFRKS